MGESQERASCQDGTWCTKGEGEYISCQGSLALPEDILPEENLLEAKVCVFRNLSYFPAGHWGVRSFLILLWQDPDRKGPYPLIEWPVHTHSLINFYLVPFLFRKGRGGGAEFCSQMDFLLLSFVPVSSSKLRCALGRLERNKNEGGILPHHPRIADSCGEDSVTTDLPLSCKKDPGYL